MKTLNAKHIAALCFVISVVDVSAQSSHTTISMADKPKPLLISDSNNYCKFWYDGLSGKIKMHFEGQCQNDVYTGSANGKGILKIFINERSLYSVEQGNFAHGKLHGAGVRKIYAEGKGAPIRTFEGMFEDGKLDGQGKIIEFGIETSSGNFSGGELNGQGIKIRGVRYLDGFFKNGILRKGSILNGNGVKEQGDFNVAGRLEGEGQLILPNGTRYNGYFMNGVLCSASVESKRYCDFSNALPVSKYEDYFDDRRRESEIYQYWQRF